MADTVTVVVSLDTRSSRAVTVVDPPFSPIDVGIRLSVTIGGSSSSMIVRLLVVRVRHSVAIVGNARHPHRVVGRVRVVVVGGDGHGPGASGLTGRDRQGLVRAQREVP